MALNRGTDVLSAAHRPFVPPAARPPTTWRSIRRRAWRAPISVTRFDRAGATVEVSGAAGGARLPIRSAVPARDARSRQLELRLSVTVPDWVIGEPVRLGLANSPGGQSVVVTDAGLARR